MNNEILEVVDNLNERNKMFLVGRIEKELEFSHEAFGNVFLKTKLTVRNINGEDDYIPIIISEKLVKNIPTCGMVKVIGQLRSYNYIDEAQKGHLDIFMYVFDIHECGDIEQEVSNFLFLDGFICKKPFLKKVPGSYIETADFILAVNISCGRSVYIPCIAWGKYAYYAKKLKIGDRILVTGKIRSRKYTITVNEEEISKETYEVAVKRLKK